MGDMSKFLNFKINSVSEDYFILANSPDPDEILHYVAFHLGLSLFAKVCKPLVCRYPE